MPGIYNPLSAEIRLQPNEVAAILASQDEACPNTIGYYPNIEALAKTVGGQKSWAMGEVFVYAESRERYLVLKQIAPSSCEMLTITANGPQDVLTAYRFPQDELVSCLRAYLDQAARPAATSN